MANETVLGEPLLDRIRARARESDASFLIVAPQSDPTRAEHPEAERRLRAALSTLRAEGIDVHGQIAHPDPFTAAMQAVRDERTDEIIVSTFPGDALRLAPARPRRPPALGERRPRGPRHRGSAGSRSEAGV